jgi:TRAP-type mannitol/chloroaromatic compound transport system permease small subunit
MHLFYKILHSTVRIINYLPILGLVVIMMLGVSEVMLRIFNVSIYGVFEMIGFIGSVVVFFSMPQTLIQKGHIRIEVIVARCTKRVQAAVDTVTGLLSIGVCALVVWQACLVATDMLRSGEVSLTLGIPFYPFVYGIAFSCVLLGLVFLSELLDSISVWRRR